jgi:hypothetical protein
MEYIKDKGKGTEMKNLKIHETMTEGIHYKFSRHGPDVVSHTPGSYKGIEGSSMFTATFRPVGGLMEHESSKIVNFILNAPWIRYYGMGLELVNNERQSQHLTVHFTTTDMVTGKVSAVDGMKKKFFGLLENQRIMSIQNKDGKLCGTIEIKSCSKNHMPTKTAMTHCVYPLKDAVKGKRREDLTEADYNNKVTHWTNLFDGERKCTDENKKHQWRMNRIAFHHLLVEEERKKKHKAPHLIHPRTHNKQAQAYAIGNGLPEWTPESHAHILATMVTDKLGEKNYILAPGFLKKSVQKALYDQNYREDYKELVEQTLRHHFIKRQCELKGISAPSKQEKKLTSQNEIWQKKYTKLENNCKRLVFENVNLKRKIKGKSPLEDPSKTSTYQVQGYDRGETCCVCSQFDGALVHISPCDHYYCRDCMEPQLDNKTIDCRHCTIDAINGGTKLKEYHCKRWEETRLMEQPEYRKRKRKERKEQEASRKRPLDTSSVQEQERMKRLKAIAARGGCA